MDVVLVGLPGSGKSVVGRRLAHRHGAAFVDLDERIERGRRPDDPGDLRGGRRGRLPGARAGGRRRPRPGRPGARRPARDRDRRRRRRRPAQPLGALPRPDHGLARRPARRSSPSACAARRTSGRWSPAATRSARSATSAAKRERFYARRRHPSVGRRRGPRRRRRGRGTARRGRIATGTGTTLLRTSTPIGRLVLGDGIAADALAAELDAMRAPRAILVSEPGAWAAVGERLATGLRERGREVVARHAARRARRPSGWPVVEAAARELAAPPRRARRAARRDRRRRARRRGRLPRGDLPARRPVHPGPDDARRPDRLVDRRQDRGRPARGQEPRRRVPPAGAIVIDVASCGRSPSGSGGPRSARRSRWRPSATSGCSSCSRPTAPAIARGDAAAFASGVVAELVERAAWAKVEVVLADERERGAVGGRITLNLGHSLGHAVEAAGGLRRAAPRRGRRLRAAGGVPDRGRASGVTPPERAARIGAAARRARPGDRAAPLPARHGPRTTSRPTRSTPAGRLRWVLPTADGVVVRDDIDPAVVERAAAAPAGRPSASPR